jgi:hypothetical protein
MLQGSERVREWQRALARCDGGRIVVLTGAPAFKCPAARHEAAMNR